MYWKEIAFIIQKTDEKAWQACIESIESLKVPDGYSYQIVAWEAKEGVNFMLVEQQVRRIRAKYRIYLNENIGFINEDFLIDMLRIFQSDENIGMLGIAGCWKLPFSGRWQEADEKYGGVYMLNASRQPVEQRFMDIPGDYVSVQAVDGMLFASQYDLPYSLDLANSVEGYCLLECLEFARNGYKIVVPAQKNLWCLYGGTEQPEILPTDLQRLTETYFGYHTVPGLEGIAYPFYSCGWDTLIKPGCRVQSAEGIFLGNHVVLEGGVCLELPKKNFIDEPRISILHSCVLGRNCVVSAANRVRVEQYVHLGENVHIADYVRQPVSPGLPFCCEGMEADSNEVVIGQSSILEDNVVVAGNIHIGRGCQIRANSVVLEDIPDYCVAAGNPARVIQLFDRERGQWLDVENNEQLKVLCEKRRQERPLLTIGIPTYNRSYYLDKSLSLICGQAGNDDFFEILVSDNDSTDNTKAIVDKYAKRYKNVRYRKNPTNIRDKNFLKVWGSGRGEYVVAAGDDDYFQELSFYQLVKTIYAHREASLIYLLRHPEIQGYQEFVGTGIDAYLDKVSFELTFISGMVIRSDLYKQIEDPNRFADSHLNQVYIQLELLRKHPVFVVLYAQYLMMDSGEARFDKSLGVKHEDSDIGKIFVQEYFDILQNFLGRGLSPDTLSKEKKNILVRQLFPLIEKMVEREVNWEIDHNLLKLYDRYYRSEPYYEEGKQRLRAFCEQYLNKKG